MEITVSIGLFGITIILMFFLMRSFHKMICKKLNGMEEELCEMHKTMTRNYFDNRKRIERIDRQYLKLEARQTAMEGMHGIKMTEDVEVDGEPNRVYYERTPNVEVIIGEGDYLKTKDLRLNP